MTFGTEKLQWCGYPSVKKISKISLFVLTMYERVRRTGGYRMTAKAALDASIARL